MMVERDLPRSMPELAGHATTTIVGGLTPAMLGVLLLNIIGVGAAIYFLRILILGQQIHLGALLSVQERQMNLIVQMHDREFDVMTTMIREATGKPPPDEIGIPLPLPRP
jgi:uncharacterized membrane protein